MKNAFQGDEKRLLGEQLENVGRNRSNIGGN